MKEQLIPCKHEDWNYCNGSCIKSKAPDAFSRAKQSYLKAYRKNIEVEVKR